MAKKEKDQVSLDEIKEVIDSCNVSELPEVHSWCPTGSTILDLSISNMLPGGIPIGRIVQIFGASSTCKSVLANTILGYALRNGMKAFLADVENAFDPAFACKFGLDPKNTNFHMGSPITVEEFFDKWLGGILKVYTDEPKVLVVDSITALPSVTEVEKSMTEQGFGGSARAKAIGLGLRKYQMALAKSNTTLFCIDQTRDSMEAFGPKETTTGGRGLEFYSATRIYLQHEANVENSKEVNVGIWVRFTISKNRVAPPMREGNMKLIYDYGVDDIASNLRFLAESRGEVDEKGAWHPAKDGKGVMNKVTLVFPEGENQERLETTSIKAWVTRIEKENLEDLLRKNVYDVWKEIYKPEERKARVW
jgi:recombination protein RecA